MEEDNQTKYISFFFLRLLLGNIKTTLQFLLKIIFANVDQFFYVIKL